MISDPIRLPDLHCPGVEGPTGEVLTKRAGEERMPELLQLFDTLEGQEADGLPRQSMALPVLPIVPEDSPERELGFHYRTLWDTAGGDIDGKNKGCHEWIVRNDGIGDATAGR